MQNAIVRTLSATPHILRRRATICSRHAVFGQLLGFLLLLAPPVSAAAQGILSFPDSLEQVSFRQFDLDDCGMFLVPADSGYIVLRDSGTFARLISSKSFIGNCDGALFPRVDFGDAILVGFNLFVDCHATVIVNVLKHKLRPEYYVFADRDDGGCRGMRSKNYWLGIPVEANDARVTMVERTFGQGEQ